MEVRQTSSFWRDLKEILDYLDASQSEMRAIKFSDAVDETIDAIIEFPDLGSPWESDKPRQQRWRFRLVRGFENYLVMYHRDGEGIFITRIVDGRRNLEAVL